MKKLAVCVSGLCTSARGDIGIQENNKILKNKFKDADFFYATYLNMKETFFKNFPVNSQVFFFEEPVPHYHPYLDINIKDHISSKYSEIISFMKKDKSGQRLIWSKHHVKQILIHSWLLKEIDAINNYDLIVRTRFDGFISKNAQFADYLIDSYKNQRCNAFAATKQNKFNELNEFSTRVGSPHEHWMLDQLIIHPGTFLNPDLVNQLYSNKLLHAAESGWYQVLSQPNGIEKHRNHDGWINHDKKILPEFFYQL